MLASLPNKANAADRIQRRLICAVRIKKIIMQSIPDPITFNKSGTFYEMVGSFMIAVAGLESILHPNNPMKFAPKQVLTLEGKVHPELRIEPFEIRKNALAKHISMSNTVASLCIMLVNTAYESVKDKNDKLETFEFFRHIRNACSHNNRFNFYKNEPERPASWRTKSIDCHKKGINNPLFGKNCFNEYLGIADAILLLWDIEQTILKIK